MIPGRNAGIKVIYDMINFGYNPVGSVLESTASAEENKR